MPLVYDGDAPCQRFLDAYNKHRPRRTIRGFVVLDTKQRLTIDGPVTVAPVVMRVFPEDLLR